MICRASMVSSPSIMISYSFSSSSQWISRLSRSIDSSQMTQFYLNRFIFFNCTASFLQASLSFCLVVTISSKAFSTYQICCYNNQKVTCCYFLVGFGFLVIAEQGSVAFYVFISYSSSYELLMIYKSCWFLYQFFFMFYYNSFLYLFSIRFQGNLNFFYSFRNIYILLTFDQLPYSFT